MCPHKSNPPSPRTTPLLRLPLLDFNGGLKKGFHGNCTLCAHCMKLMLCTWCRMDAFHQTAGWKSCFSLKWWVSLWDGRMNLCLILHYVERLDHEWGSAHVEEERDVCVGGQGFCEQTLNTLLRKNGTFVLVDRGFVSKHSIRSWGRTGCLCWWTGVLWANAQYTLSSGDWPALQNSKHWFTTSLEEGAGKWCSEFGGRCQKAMLGVCCSPSHHCCCW